MVSKDDYHEILPCFGLRQLVEEMPHAMVSIRKSIVDLVVKTMVGHIKRLMTVNRLHTYIVRLARGIPLPYQCQSTLQSHTIVSSPASTHLGGHIEVINIPYLVVARSAKVLTLVHIEGIATIDIVSRKAQPFESLGYRGQRPNHTVFQQGTARRKRREAVQGTHRAAVRTEARSVGIRKPHTTPHPLRNLGSYALCSS